MAARLSGLTTAEAEAILAEPAFQGLLRRCKASAALSLEERHDRLVRMARALKCGQVFVNNYGAGGGVELPFGGVKRSGHGREKGFEALYGFSTLKTVAIQHG